MSGSRPMGVRWEVLDVQGGRGITDNVYGTWLIDNFGDLRYKTFGGSKFSPIAVSKPEYLRGKREPGWFILKFILTA